MQCFTPEIRLGGYAEQVGNEAGLSNRISFG